MAPNSQELMEKFLEDIHSVMKCLLLKIYFIQIFVVGIHVFSLNTPLSVK